MADTEEQLIEKLKKRRKVVSEFAGEKKKSKKKKGEKALKNVMSHPFHSILSGDERSMK